MVKGINRLAACAMVGLLFMTVDHGFAQPIVTVSGNGGFDYQPSVIRPWADPTARIVVFERLGAGLSGDLLVTSSDDGLVWADPVTVVGTAANERHPALLQTGESSFQLFYLSNATGAFRIHRASSEDGQTFVEQGPLVLGWPTGGEINPHVIRQDDGTLVMTYHRLSGAAFIARSIDDGASWDTDRVQISPANAALPRLAYREADGRYLLVYQTNPGNNQLQMWTRTTADPTVWTSTPEQIGLNGNNHDGFPLVQADGRFAIIWARVAEGAFQIFSSESDDGLTWTEPRQQISRPDLANVQPHGLLKTHGVIDLYWGAAQDQAGSDFAIVRQPRPPLSGSAGNRTRPINQVRWPGELSIHSPGVMVHALPALGGETLVIGDWYGVIHAVDAVSGKLQWTYRPDDAGILIDWPGMT